MEKFIWHKFGKNWPTDVDSLVSVMEAAKSGQTAGISLAILGCRFNEINQLEKNRCGKESLYQKCCMVQSHGHLIA